MKYSTLIILILAISACSVFESNNIVNEKLIGEWKWIQSSGGFIGEVIYADSVDYEMTLSINENNHAFLYRNDELKMTYDIHIGKDEWNKGELTMMPRSEKIEVEKIISEVRDDKLYLRDGCTDCYTYIFER